MEKLSKTEAELKKCVAYKKSVYSDFSKASDWLGSTAVVVKHFKTANLLK